MTWTLFNLQPFLTQLLQDLWTSTPTGTFFKDQTTLLSQLWLQGTFYNLTPDEIGFFTLILYILMNTFPPQIQATTNLGPSAPHPDWPLPVSNYNCTLNLSPCYRPNNYLPSGLVTYPSSFCWYRLHC